MNKYFGPLKVEREGVSTVRNVGFFYPNLSRFRCLTIFGINGCIIIHDPQILNVSWHKN